VLRRVDRSHLPWVQFPDNECRNIRRQSQFPQNSLTIGIKNVNISQFVHVLRSLSTYRYIRSHTVLWVSHKLLHVKPVSHRTRLGTRFQYYTRVDWYEYWAPTVPGDELVRFRLECSTSMYEQSTDILGQARFVTVWTRFANDFHTIVVRFQVRSN
jgi:hypothetical protein